MQMEKYLPRSGAKASKTGLYLAADHYREGVKREIIIQARILVRKCADCNEETDWLFVREFSDNLSARIRPERTSSSLPLNGRMSRE